MAYGDDITEGLPYNLSNPGASRNYQLTGEAYDLSVNGLPFYVFSSDETPYRRQTAPYRKEQVDQTREPGEQSLTGWWFRSQSSFHLGQGIKYFEPAQDESLRFQYTESKGIDVWTKGQATLILDTDQSHVTTGALKSNDRPNQHLRSVKWKQNGNTYDGVILHDDGDIDKIFPVITASVTNKALTSNVATLTTAVAHGFAVGFEVVVSNVDATFNGTYIITAVTSTTFSYAKTAANVTSTAVSPAGTATSESEHFVDYAGGGAYRVYAMCDDGVNVYWLTLINDAGTDRTAMYKRPIDSSTAAVEMWKTSSVIIADACMEFTKERIIATINNAVYEISTTATALPTAVYTNPVTSFNYSSIASSGTAIYVAGFSGSNSNIQKFTLTTQGAMPTLTSAITAAEMPSGELIYKIYYYLGYMMIGTTKGVRVAEVFDDGSLKYGPLNFETEQPVYDFAARDRFVFAATNVDGEAGVTRIDLGNPIETLVFPYAWDSYYVNGGGRYTTACAFINGTDRIAFCTNHTNSNGHVYIESADRLVSSGYLTTGRIRYNTLELKLFKLLTLRVDNVDGSIGAKSISPAGTEYNIGGFAEDAIISELSISYPPGAQEYLSFKFTLSRSETDSTKGPILKGYQVKALPAIPRQRLIQYPLACYDNEKDKFGTIAGYEGSAYDRLVGLEAVENVGDSIRIEDFRNGESYVGLIEDIQFVNRTPPDKRFSGFGGVLYITIRSI